jgi:hypothetical protein
MNSAQGTQDEIMSMTKRKKTEQCSQKKRTLITQRHTNSYKIGA